MCSPRRVHMHVGRFGHLIPAHMLNDRKTATERTFSDPRAGHAALAYAAPHLAFVPAFSTFKIDPSTALYHCSIMRFGPDFREAQVPIWGDRYVQYDRLKTAIKQTYWQAQYTGIEADFSGKCGAALYAPFSGAQFKRPGLLGYEVA